MAKKPISQKRADREKQENLALQRVFNVFLLGIAAEVYLFIVYRNYIMGTAHSLLVWYNILRWGALAGLVLLLGAFGVATMWEAVFADVGVSVIAILNAMRALKRK